MTKKRTFYQLSEPTRRRWSKMPQWLYLLLVLVIALMSLLGTSIIGAIAQMIVLGLESLSPTSVGTMTAGSLTVWLILNFLPLFFCVDFALRLLERRRLVSVGMQLKGAAQKYLRGLGVGLGLLGSSVLIMSLLGYVALENPFQLTSFSGALITIPGWVVQGAAEEVLTRGFLLQIFGRVTNSMIGIGVSSVFFAVMHTSNNSFSLLALINLLLFSLFAALFTLYERGLWGIFAIHSVWNWAQGNLFGLQVSGLEIKSSIILDLKETGPDLLTGGSYGPEGGLIISSVLIIAIVVMGMTYKRRPSTQRSPHSSS